MHELPRAPDTLPGGILIICCHYISGESLLGGVNKQRLSDSRLCPAWNAAIGNLWDNLSAVTQQRDSMLAVRDQPGGEGVRESDGFM